MSAKITVVFGEDTEKRGRSHDWPGSPMGMRRSSLRDTISPHENGIAI
ncbi:MAG: hypothetical protein AB1813_28455 [Verrucomicrobiota bacterium]